MALNLRPQFELKVVAPKVVLALDCGVVLVNYAAPAAVETLANALASDYANNPTTGAERALQRATDELVPQALSGWRPTVMANADAGIRRTDNNIISAANSEPAGISIELNQPIFRG